VFYCTDYRICERILENSWIFIKNSRDTLNTKYFQNPIVYYLLFYFFSIFDIFFFYSTCLWFSKNCKYFCVVLLYGSEILSKNSAKLYFFLSKKIEIFEIKNFNKIPTFTISFLLFSIFGIFFSISPI